MINLWTQIGMVTEASGSVVFHFERTTNGWRREIESWDDMGIATELDKWFVRYVNAVATWRSLGFLVGL